MPYIAKVLGKSVSAIENKAKELDLPCTKDSTGAITASQLAKVLGVDVKTVTLSWMKKHGLKHTFRPTRTSRKFYLVEIDDFWEWAKENQNRFDSRRFAPHALGAEPPWMADKRKSDLLLQKKGRWQPEEVQALELLSRMYSGQLTYKQIANEIKRPASYIGKRLARLTMTG